MTSIVLETEDGHLEEVPRALLPHLPVLDRLVAFEGERPAHAVDRYTLDLLRAVGLGYARAAADGQLDAYALPGDDGDTSRDALCYLGVETSDLFTVRELRAKQRELQGIMQYLQMATDPGNKIEGWFHQAAPTATFEDFWEVRSEWLSPKWCDDRDATQRFWERMKVIRVQRNTL